MALPGVHGEIDLVDAAGDQRVYVGSQSWPDPMGTFAEVDLLGLRIHETEDAVIVTMETASIPDDPNFMATVNFTYGGSEYQLVLDDRYAPVARLHHRGVEPMPRDLDMIRQDTTRVVEISKSELIDASGTAGAIGTKLTVRSTHSTMPVSIAGQGTPRDTIEEQGEMVLELGARPATDVRIGSPLPTRVSNGAATVHAYTLTLQSLIAEDTIISLDGRDAPAGWDVQFPADTVKLKAGEVREVPVLVSVPFNHQHGQYQGFWVEVRHLGEPNILSEVALGVRYTEIPQLAGHHPRTWFHSADRENSPNPEGMLFFNTLEDDPSDQKQDAPATCYTQGIQVKYSWNARLNTPVWIGLDFDLSRTIDVTIPLYSQRELTDLTLSADLWLSEFLIASAQNISIPDVGTDGTAIEFALPVEEWFDEVPPGVKRFMELMIDVEQPVAPPYACIVDPPVWRHGGMMSFPLFEYHDQLPLSSDRILSGEDVPNAVQPGSNLVVRHNLTTQPESSYGLRLYGHGAAHAFLVPGGSARTNDSGKATFLLVIEVPEDAAEGQPFDLIVEASDDESIGLHRTAFVVSASGVQRHDDEPNVGQAVPVGAPLLFLALAMAIVRRR